jgi:hypothetical protein
MTIQAHANAILGLLAADIGPPALATLDGFVPAGQLPPYVVVYFSIASPGGTVAADKVSLDFNSTVMDVNAYCHCVGGNAIAARAVESRVRTALLDVTPVITGRGCFPIRHVDAMPMQRDESTGPLVMDVVDVYCLVSVPG